MQSQKAGLPFATRARKPLEVCIENDSDRKFLSPKLKKYFLEITFLYVLCYSDHYEPKIFFSQNIFSGNYSCSCFMLPCTLIIDIMSRKYFFDFRNSQLPFDIRFWTRGFPSKCDLRRQAYPLQLQLESGSSRYRRYVSRMTWIENCLHSKSKFFKVFLKTTFLHHSLSCYPVHYKYKPNFFSKLVKMKILITKSTKIVQLVLRKLVKNKNFDYVINDQPPPPPPVINRKHLETPPRLIT